MSNISHIQFHLNYAGLLNSALNRKERVGVFLFVSSEGALYVILPYDRSLITILSIDAVMTLLTLISMKTKITKMTISDDNF